MVHRLCAIVFLLVLMLVLPVPGKATQVEQIAADFKPVAGYVVKQAGADFLIDLDARSGISAGDLFSVVKPGEKIIHPVTKEVLGTLEEVKGVLRVVRVRSGFSHATPVGGPAKGIASGDSIRRFSHLQTALWDYTGRGEAFYTRLTNALPDLEWLGYAEAQRKRPDLTSPPANLPHDLVFVLTASNLEVRDRNFLLLHSYPHSDQLRTELGVAPATASAALPQAAPSQPVWQPQSFPAAGGGVFAGPGYEHLAKFPAVVLMSSFLRDGKQELVAVTDGSAIEVYSIRESTSRIARLDTVGGMKVLALHWWRPAESAAPFVAVTSWDGNGVRGSLYRFQDNELVVAAESIPFILGAFDRDQNGSPELLLGQPFDTQDFFAPDVKILRLADGKVRSSKPDFPLPRRFTVQGALFADVTGDGQPETIFIRNGFLHVFSGEKEIYKSSRQMGGSLSGLTFEINPGSREILTSHAFFEVPPVAADLDHDGRPEILAIAADRSYFSLPGLGPNVKKSWLAAFQYRETMFAEGRVGSDFSAPLQGLALADGRALLITDFDQSDGSHLVSVPLPK